MFGLGRRAYITIIWEVWFLPDHNLYCREVVRNEGACLFVRMPGAAPEKFHNISRLSIFRRPYPLI